MFGIQPNMCSAHRSSENNFPCIDGHLTSSRGWATLVRMDTGDTRERLIRITAEELARNGYRGMSLRRVASRAGIGAATVFHHFPNGKQGLYEATVQHIVDEVASLAMMSLAETEGQSPEDVIVQRAETLWDLLADKSELAAMLLHESFEHEARDGDLLQTHAETVVQYAVSFIEEAQRRGELPRFDPRRFLLWGTLHIIGYHGAPRMQRQLFSDGRSQAGEREAFLAMMRAYLQGRVPGSE